MATIDIRRTHQLGVAGAKTKAEELARELEQKLSIEWSWEGDNVRFKASKGKAKGTKGLVTVGDSEVRVEIDLPLLLRAMKGPISSKVNEKLDGLFNG